MKIDISQSHSALKNSITGPSIHKACKSGSYDRVNQLIAEGININIKDTIGCSALHYAVEEGHAKIVKFLIKNGARVDIKDNFKLTPLYYAARFNSIDSAKLLLKHGANVNGAKEHIVKNDLSKKIYPLFYACLTNNFELTQLLISYEATIDSDIIGAFTRKAPIIFVEEDYIIIDNFIDSRIITLLIDKNFDINWQDADGNTLLHHAVFAKNCQEIIKLLLESGADWNIKNRDKGLKNSNGSLKEDQDQFFTDKNAKTALYLSVFHNCPTILEYITDNNDKLRKPSKS